QVVDVARQPLAPRDRQGFGSSSRLQSRPARWPRGGSFFAWVGNLRSGLQEAMSSIDERNMGEGLGEISNQPPGFRRVFLRQQPDVVAQSNKSLEQFACIRRPPCQMVGVSQPE